MENNIKPVTTPEEAAAQFSGEQYLEWVLDYLSREAKSWESLKSVAAAQARPERIRKFVLQRFLAAEAFTGGRDGDPGFLGFAVANLSESPDPGAEHALELLENKRREELGGDDPGQSVHRKMWGKLLTALGVSAEEVSRAEAKEPTRNYVAELADAYSNSEWQTAIAAFAAHEKLVVEEFKAIAALLANNLDLTGSDTEVLTWHAKGDAKYVIETIRVLEAVAADQEGRDLIYQGVRRQMDACRDLYDGLAKYLQDK